MRPLGSACFRGPEKVYEGSFPPSINLFLSNPASERRSLIGKYGFSFLTTPLTLAKAMFCLGIVARLRCRYEGMPPMGVGHNGGNEVVGIVRSVVQGGTGRELQDICLALTLQTPPRPDQSGTAEVVNFMATESLEATAIYVGVLWKSFDGPSHCSIHCPQNRSRKGEISAIMTTLVDHLPNISLLAMGFRRCRPKSSGS